MRESQIITHKKKYNKITILSSNKSVHVYGTGIIGSHEVKIPLPTNILYLTRGHKKLKWPENRVYLYPVSSMQNKGSNFPFMFKYVHNLKVFNFGLLVWLIF